MEACELLDGHDEEARRDEVEREADDRNRDGVPRNAKCERDDDHPRTHLTARAHAKGEGESRREGHLVPIDAQGEHLADEPKCLPRESCGSLESM